MEQLLAKYQVTEVLIGGEQKRAGFAARLEHCVVADSGFGFGNIHDFVVQWPEPGDNLSIHAFIRNDLHPAIFSKG